jgi:hypothetical protein
MEANIENQFKLLSDISISNLGSFTHKQFQQNNLPTLNLATTGLIVIKLFSSTIFKLCLSLAGLASLILCLRVRPEPTQVQHFSGTPLKGKASHFTFKY